MVNVCFSVFNRTSAMNDTITRLRNTSVTWHVRLMFWQWKLKYIAREKPITQKSLVKYAAENVFLYLTQKWSKFDRKLIFAMALLRNSGLFLQTLKRCQSVPCALYHKNVSINRVWFVVVWLFCFSNDSFLHHVCDRYLITMRIHVTLAHSTKKTQLLAQDWLVRRLAVMWWNYR